MNDYNAFSDTELIELLKESDHSAYTEIYKRYFYLLYVHAYKKVQNEDQVKDIIQDIFTRLWIKREYDLPDSNLAGYLFTSVRNRIFDLFAHQQVKNRYVESLQEYFKHNFNVSTDHRIRENQLKEYIERSIQSLPPKMKLIFELSRKAGLSHKEISRQLNISENNVSKQVNNALRLLRTKLGLIVYLYFLTRF